MGAAEPAEVEEEREGEVFKEGGAMGRRAGEGAGEGEGAGACARARLACTTRKSAGPNEPRVTTHVCVKPARCNISS